MEACGEEVRRCVLSMARRDFGETLGGFVARLVLNLAASGEGEPTRDTLLKFVEVLAKHRASQEGQALQRKRLELEERRLWGRAPQGARPPPAPTTNPGPASPRDPDASGASGAGLTKPAPEAVRIFDPDPPPGTMVDQLVLEEPRESEAEGLALFTPRVRASGDSP